MKPWQGLVMWCMMLAACAAAPAAESGAKEEDVREWHGSQSRARRSATLTARDGASWLRMWEMAGRRPPGRLPAGAMAVAVFMDEKRTGGYAVDIVSVEREEGMTTVRYRIRRPPQGARVTQALTAPFVVRIVPASPDPVAFVQIGHEG